MVVKWRGLPKRFGNWHSIYMRMNRWAKKGVLDRVFAKLQEEQIVQLKIEAFSLDSTSVKVHPDGTGALKKTAPKPLGNREEARRALHRQPCKRHFTLGPCNQVFSVCDIWSRVR